MAVEWFCLKPHTSWDEVSAKIANSSMYFPYFQDCIGALDGTHIEAVQGRITMFSFEVVKETKLGMF
ncbi:hypothetical protein QQ045_015821 [Rhodiola kirilowii]